MDALAAAAMQRMLMFTFMLHLMLKPMRLGTPEALLESPTISTTLAYAKGHCDFRAAAANLEARRRSGHG
jgi:hypothetical protein